MFAESAFASQQADADADSDSDESDEDDFFQQKASSSSASEHRAQAAAATLTDSAKSRRGDSSSKWTLAVRGVFVVAQCCRTFFLMHIFLTIFFGFVA